VRLPSADPGSWRAVRPGRPRRRLLDAELTRLATATGRTKSWLINEALRSYVANEQQFLAAVEEGKQALREGRVVDHATVVSAFDRLITPAP
jgi:RHH-type rel operon transcriptional repressor/antitoxin RelB